MAARTRTLSAGHRAPLRPPDSFSKRSELVDLLSSCQRPSVLLSEREISVLRRGLTKRGWKRTLYLEPSGGYQGVYAAAGMLSRARAGLTGNVKIPEMGGCAADFCCRCDAPLRIPHDLAVADSYECSVCGVHSSGVLYDDAVRFCQNEDMAGVALSLALVGSIEKSKDYAAKTVEILIGYADRCAAGPVESDECRMVARPADEAALIIALAQAYDLIYFYRGIGTDQRKKIEDALLMRAAEIYVKQPTAGACGSRFLAAIGVVGLVLRDAGLVEHSLYGFASKIREELGEDGLMPGPLVGSHFRSLSALVQLAEACHRVGIDLYNFEPVPGKSMKAMFVAPLFGAYPSLRLPAVDDDPYNCFLPLDLYEVACRRWNDALFAWVLKRGYRFGDGEAGTDHNCCADGFSRRSFYAFVFGRDLPGRVGSQTLKSCLLPSMGLCALRADDDSMATLRYGTDSDFGDNDGLGFTFYSNDSLLVPDYGCPPGASDISDWAACAAAHNTVLIDGARQRTTRPAAIISTRSARHLQLVRAVSSGVHGDVDHTRTVVLLDGMCVLVDSLTGRSEHDYDWIARVDGATVPGGEPSGEQISLAGGPHVTVDRVFGPGDVLRMTWADREDNMAMAVWSASGSGLLAVGSSPTYSAFRRSAIVVCRRHGRGAGFVAALVPHKSAEVVLTRDGRVIAASRGDQADYLYVKSDLKETTSQRLQTDGELAYVKMCHGRVQAVGVVDGTAVFWDGEPLLECGTQVHCAEVDFGGRSPAVTYCADMAGTVHVKTTSRAMRVNGHRAAATNSKGRATLRVTSAMLTNTPNGTFV